jgi:alpha-ketoglutarate-dependent taurine dioxygenase
MLMRHACAGGDTYFIPLQEFYALQSEETRHRWDTLWMCPGGEAVHPLVYTHAVRGDTTMMFHCGEPFCQGWIQQTHPTTALDTQDSTLTFLPPRGVQRELTEKLDEALDTIGIRLQWEEGDMAFNDNLAMAHYASPGTQGGGGREGQGLRVLDRTTVAGDTTPGRGGVESFI